MEIKLLNITEKKAEEILPGRVQGLIGQPNTLVFGAMEGKELFGVAIATQVSPTSFCINHIAKSEDSDEGVYELLLTNMENVFRDNGARSIVVKIVGAPQEVMETHRVFNTAGFIPTALNGHLITYSLEQIVNTQFYDLISKGKVQKYFTRIKTHRQLSKQQMEELLKALKSKKQQGTFNPDKKSSRYYILKDKICGYIDASFDGENAFLIKDIYAPYNKEDKFALPTLMASVIVEMKEACDEKGTLLITVYKKDIYNWFKSFFTESVSEENIFEYVKVM